MSYKKPDNKIAGLKVFFCVIFHFQLAQKFRAPCASKQTEAQFISLSPTKKNKEFEAVCFLAKLMQ